MIVESMSGPGFELLFPHRYEIKQVDDLPGSGSWPHPVHFFPGLKDRPEHDGEWIQIIPASGQPWIGVFRFGHPQPPAISKVLSTPDPDRLCMVSAGAVYQVRTDSPQQCEQLNIDPVTDVRAIPECALIVFATFHKLMALG